MRKVVINAPPRAPMGLEECAESFEKTFELLKSMKKGAGPVRPLKAVLDEAIEDCCPPKVVTEPEHAIIKDIAKAVGTNEYDACAFSKPSGL